MLFTSFSMNDILLKSNEFPLSSTVSILYVVVQGWVNSISFIVSVLTVYLRDLQHLIGVALQLLFYAAPVVYSPENIPEGYEWILKYNPMTYIINAYRDIFYNQTMIDVKSLLNMILGASIACVIGYVIFNKLQKGIVEQL